MKKIGGEPIILIDQSGSLCWRASHEIASRWNQHHLTPIRFVDDDTPEFSERRIWGNERIDAQENKN